MGIYVSEINMPKGEGSKLVLQIFPSGEVYDGHGIRLGIANCAEAVPVPSHGDLIDRKPFIEFIKTHWDSYDQWFVEQLEARPTIIEAEEGE